MRTSILSACGGVGLALLATACLSSAAGTSAPARPVPTDEHTRRFSTSVADNARAAVDNGSLDNAFDVWGRGLADARVYERTGKTAVLEHIRAELASAWPALEALAERQLAAALAAGDVWGALRIADLVVYPNGGAYTERSATDAITARAPAAAAWRERALARVTAARDRAAEARQAEAAGHHALAACLHAALGDSAARDRVIARVPRGDAGADLPLALDLGDDAAELAEALEPKLRARYELRDDAPHRLIVRAEAPEVRGHEDPEYRSDASGEYRLSDAALANPVLVYNLLTAEAAARERLAAHGGSEQACIDADATCEDVLAARRLATLELSQRIGTDFVREHVHGDGRLGSSVAVWTASAGYTLRLEAGGQVIAPERDLSMAFDRADGRAALRALRATLAQEVADFAAQLDGVLGPAADDAAARANRDVEKILHRATQASRSRVDETSIATLRGVCGATAAQVADEAAARRLLGL